MPDEAVIGEDPSQIGMPVEHDAVQIERLTLEPTERRPNTGERGQDRKVVLGAERANAQALIQLDRQQVDDHREPQSIVRAIAVIEVIHAAQV